jgi:hypothetical protein
MFWPKCNVSPFVFHRELIQLSNVPSGKLIGNGDKNRSPHVNKNRDFLKTIFKCFAVKYGVPRGNDWYQGEFYFTPQISKIRFVDRKSKHMSSCSDWNTVFFTVKLHITNLEEKPWRNVWIFLLTPTCHVSGYPRQVINVDAA